LRTIAFRTTGMGRRPSFLKLDADICESFRPGWTVENIQWADRLLKLFVGLRRPRRESGGVRAI
jgi:hypothetical protein